MKVSVLADIVRSVEKHSLREDLSNIYVIVFEDWSVARRNLRNDLTITSMSSNVCVFRNPNNAEEWAAAQPINTGQVMSVMEWVHRCPEPMAWRDDESEAPPGKTWWAVTRMIGGSQATTQFSDFTEAEKYYNTHGENPGTPKQLIKMEVAREWEG